MELNPSQQAFLETQPHAILATIRGDGSPQVSPVWFRWQHPRVLMSSMAHTAKIANVRRDPRVVVCIDDPDRGAYVSIAGTCELIEGRQADEMTYELIGKYHQGRDADDYWETVRDQGDWVVVALAGDRWIWHGL